MRERYNVEIQSTSELILQNDPGAKLPDLNTVPKQKDLVRAVMQSRFEKLGAIVDKRMSAVLNGGQAPHATLWKTADHTPENLMDGRTFQIAALCSVGAKIMEKEIECPVCEKASLDVYGDHALVCMNSGTVVHRHNDLYRLFVNMGREGLLSIQPEKELFFPQDQSTWKADLVMVSGVPGLTSQPTAFDLVVTCNFSKTMLNRAAKEPLAAAMSGEDRKMKEFDEKVRSIGYEFIPLAFETTGGHSPTVAPFAHYLIRQKSLMRNLPFGEVSNHFWQLLSVVLQKSNAQAILQRIRM